MAQFHSLKIKSITRQTEKAVSITFEVPELLKTAFDFKAGQYISLKTLIDDQEIRRDYSLSSSPASGDLTITVKEMFMLLMELRKNLWYLRLAPHTHLITLVTIH